MRARITLAAMACMMALLVCLIASVATASPPTSKMGTGTMTGTMTATPAAIAAVQFNKDLKVAAPAGAYAAQPFTGIHEAATAIDKPTTATDADVGAVLIAYPTTPAFQTNTAQAAHPAANPTALMGTVTPTPHVAQTTTLVAKWTAAPGPPVGIRRDAWNCGRCLVLTPLG